jgi:hypothetical protein
VRALARRGEINLTIVNSDIMNPVVFSDFAEDESVYYNFGFKVGRRRVRRGRGNDQSRTITDEFDVNSRRALNNYDVSIVWAREILAMAKTSITIAAAP